MSSLLMGAGSVNWTSPVSRSTETSLAPSFSMTSVELLAPAWAGNMRRVHNAVRDHFEREDIWQGKRNGAETGPPPWFDETGAEP